MTFKQNAILLVVSFVLAIAMNFFLFYFDKYHSTELAALIMNHLLNICIWFVVFSLLLYVIAYIVVLIKFMVSRRDGDGV